MTQLPLFSVIIPTYHRNESLRKCLDCLAPEVQTLPSTQYEVIVSDDGSKTTAQAMISEQYSWVKWVAGSCRGPAANRNNGAKYARGKWLAFADDDCLPDPQWLEAYAEAIASQPSCLVFEGRTYVDRPRRSLAEKSPVNETGGYLWSCNFAIQRQLFESMAGFDERFPYAAMEDVDLRQRLTKAGYTFSFINSASVCHPWRHQGDWNKIQQHQKSVLIYLSLHPEELAMINSNYYLWRAFRGFVKYTIPGILQFKGAGIIEAFLEHINCLQMAFILRVKFFEKKQNIS